MCLGYLVYLQSCVGYKSQLQNEYGTRALELENSGNLADALAYYEKLYQIDRSADVYLKVLELSLDLGDTKRAGELIESMPSSLRKNYSYRELRAYHALKINNYRIASREYKSLIEDNYQPPRVINNYGLSRYHLGDYAGALDIIRSLPDDAYDSTAVLILFSMCLPPSIEDSIVLSDQDINKSESEQSIFDQEQTDNNLPDQKTKPSKIKKNIIPKACSEIGLEEYKSKAMLLSTARTADKITDEQYLYVDSALKSHVEHALDLRLSFLDAFVETIEDQYKIIVPINAPDTVDDTAADADTDINKESEPAEPDTGNSDGQVDATVATKGEPTIDTSGDVLLSDQPKLEYLYYYSLFSTAVLHLTSNNPFLGNPSLSDLINSLKKGFQYGILSTQTSQLDGVRERLTLEFDDLVEQSKGGPAEKELISLVNEFRSEQDEEENTSIPIETTGQETPNQDISDQEPSNQNTSDRETPNQNTSDRETPNQQ